MKNVLLIVLLAISPLFQLAAKADAAGEALFQKCVEAEDRIKVLQSKFVIKNSMGATSNILRGELKLQKPNRAFISMQGGKISDERKIVSDGKKFTVYMSADNEFQLLAPDPSGANVGRAMNLEASVFYNSDTLNQMKAQGTGVKISGTSVIGGVTCKEIKVFGTGAFANYKIYVGPDFLLRGSVIVSGAGNDQTTVDSRLTELKTALTLPSNAFAFVMPKGAKPFETRIASNTKPNSGTTTDDTDLFAPGKTAPDFQLNLTDGTKATLSVLLKANKVVLLMFWSKGFEPCRDELPELAKLQTDLKSRGLETLTINTTDSSKEIQKFWADGKLKLKAAYGGERVAEKYRVGALPTNYLIGNNGKVLARFEGFDDDGIMKALERAGVK